MKKTLAWAVKKPDGYIPPDTVSLIRKRARIFILGYSSDPQKDWLALRREGYSCVRVEIKEVVRSKKK